jgi:hypothetical protein
LRSRAATMISGLRKAEVDNITLSFGWTFSPKIFMLNHPFRFNKSLALWRPDTAVAGSLSDDKVGDAVNVSLALTRTRR